SRSFRRSVKPARHARPSGQAQQPGKPRRQPWNKGLALTATPTLGTVRRWLQACVDEGTVERKGVEHTGKPGRPATLYGLTEKGRNLPRTPPEVAKMQWEQVRRQQNARKRRAMQRNAQALNAVHAKVAKAQRKYKAATDTLKQLETRQLEAEMAVCAIKALINADGDFSVLLPEEIDTLAEAGILIEKNGEMMLAGNCVEAFDRAVVPA
ncbi:MAG TPA: hypothetical protein VMG58_17080, partial [Candidatus Sulfotelmatobacter sp.]|nr:hypothetical protein [Candidatus Sulfotelmatobacter sp.]